MKNILKQLEENDTFLKGQNPFDKLQMARQNPWRSAGSGTALAMAASHCPTPSECALQEQRVHQEGLRELLPAGQF